MSTRALDLGRGEAWLRSAAAACPGPVSAVAAEYARRGRVLMLARAVSRHLDAYPADPSGRFGWEIELLALLASLGVEAGEGAAA